MRCRARPAIFPVHTSKFPRCLGRRRSQTGARRCHRACDAVTLRLSHRELSWHAAGGTLTGVREKSLISRGSRRLDLQSRHAPPSFPCPFVSISQHAGYWLTTSFLKEVDRTKETTFYDSVTGARRCRDCGASL